MLPGQTILETADFEFPSVKAETRFLIQWIEGAGEVLGATEVRVFPTNLLSELKPLLGDGVLGIFDPQNELKQSLANNRVQFADLENTVLENFRGKLAVVGPFGSNKTNPITVEQIKTLAKNGVAVVWVLRPDDNSENPRPSFYSVPANQTASIVVQPELTANIGKNPRSQLNLIYFCKLALHPQPLTFPILKSQPE